MNHRFRRCNQDIRNVQNVGIFRPGIHTRGRVLICMHRTRQFLRSEIPPGLWKGNFVNFIFIRKLWNCEICTAKFSDHFVIQTQRSRIIQTRFVPTHTVRRKFISLEKITSVFISHPETPVMFVEKIGRSFWYHTNLRLVCLPAIYTPSQVLFLSGRIDHLYHERNTGKRLPGQAYRSRHFESVRWNHLITLF